MGYIGNEPTTGHFPVDNFTSSGGSTYTLAKAPASAGAIEVSVQGVLQPTTAYTVSGTTLNMAGVTTGVKIFVRHLGETLSLPTPADGSVTTAKLGVNAVDGTKIAMGSDARGDILYHGATDYARLAKGTSAQVLTMGANDPAWADAAGGGKIVSVTSVNKTDAWTATVTNTWVDVTGMTLTTPTLATGSKVLILCNFTANSTVYHGSFRIVDGSGNLITGFVGDAVGTATRSTFGNAYSDMGTLSGGQMSCCIIDNITTTAARTYKVQAWRGSSGTMHINRLQRTSTVEMDFRMPANITAMEIGA